MSAEKSLGAQAISALEIDDVFLIESSAKANRLFNQTDRSAPTLLTLQRYRVDEQVVRQERAPSDAPEKKFLIIRFFFIGEIALALPGFVQSDPEAEIPDNARLASMTFTFAVDYRCQEREPTVEMLGAFSRNVVFHAWPYWREAAHAECARMRLPSVTVPMFKAAAPTLTPAKPE